MLLQNIDFDIQLDGQTKLSGIWINNNSPLPATIAYGLGEGIFIIGVIDGVYLKMVEIRVTGEDTFVWMSAKSRSAWDSKCEDQLTFSEDCYQGTTVNGEQYYNVQLVAVPKTGKNRVKSKKYTTYLEIK